MSAPGKNLGIVVGLDGSPSSKVALYWATQEAAMRNVALTLVHVVNPMVPNWPGAPDRVEFDQWQLERSRVLIDDAVRLVMENESTGDRHVTVNHEVLFGTTVPKLVDLSKDAQMVVVGSRERDAVSRLLLGSVSSGLVHHAHCPVAVIHDKLMPRPLEAPVLVGIDGSPASELATAIAFDEASRRGVELVALHAWSDVEIFELPGLDWKTVKSQEELTLAERLAGWQERYPDVEVRRVVVRDRPALALLRDAESAQLVVVGSHGRGGFAGMLLGSVSTTVVNGAHTPVIVARQS